MNIVFYVILFVCGAIAGAMIAKNNQDKAFAALDAAKKAYEEGLTRLKEMK